MFGSKSIGLLLPLFISSTVNGLRIPFTRNVHYMSTISSDQNIETAAPSSEPVYQSVFVGNLPLGKPEDEIRSFIIEKVGESCKNIRFANDKRTGRFRGFAHLDFADSSEAQAAIASLNGVELSERAIVANISEDRKRTEPRPRTSTGATPQENSVYIGNLDYQAKEDDLVAVVNANIGEGKATKVRIATDRETGSSKGFAFIDFASPEFAAEAIASLNNALVLGKEIKVASAVRKDDLAQRERGAPSGDRRSSGLPEYTVFLGNLNWDMTSEVIEEMVNDVVGQGIIQKIRVAVDRETGRPRGFAHVDFKDAASAQKAVDELNGLEVLGRSIRVDHATGGAAGTSAPRSFGGDRRSGGSSRGGDYGDERRSGGRGGGGDRRGGDRYNENRGRGSGGGEGGDYGSW